MRALLANFAFFPFMRNIMVVFVLMFSIFAGLLTAWFLNLFSSKEIEDKKVDIEIRLLASFHEHKKQLNHMRKQKERLEAKKSSPDLIFRYAEDMRILETRIHELENDITQIWSYRIIKEIQSLYLDDVASFPVAHSDEWTTGQQEYDTKAASLRIYLERIRNRYKALTKKKFVAPKGIGDQKALAVIEKKRTFFLERYRTLIEKTDQLHDQFQYLHDAMQVKKINDIEEEQLEVEEILGGVSSYLYEQSIQVEEFDITLTDHTRELDFVSDDIKAQLSAEREVQEYMREKIKKRHLSREVSQKHRS